MATTGTDVPTSGGPGTGGVTDDGGSESESAGTTTTGSTGAVSVGMTESSSGSSSESSTGSSSGGSSSGESSGSSSGESSSGESSSGESSSGGIETGGVPLCEPGQEVMWARAFTGDEEEDAVRGLAIDGQGNVIVTGYFTGAIDFGGGLMVAPNHVETIYVLKLDPAGEHLWSEQYDGPNGSRALGLAIDGDDNIIVSGMQRGGLDFGGGPLAAVEYDDAFVAKLTPEGGHVWSRSFGGFGSDIAREVAADAAGAALFVVETSGVVDFGGGPTGKNGTYTAALVKLDANGKHVWSRAFGSGLVGQSIYARDVAVDADGDVVMVGEFQASVDFGGGEVAAADGSNLYVLRYTAEGAFVGHTVSTGKAVSGVPYVAGVAIDAQGRIHLGGWVSGSLGFGGVEIFGGGLEVDGWVGLLGADAAPQWLAATSGVTPQWRFVSGVASNAGGQTAITGNFVGDLKYGDQMLVTPDLDSYTAYAAKLDAEGAPVWVRKIGDLDQQFGERTVIDAAGAVFVAGIFSGGLEVGGEQFSSLGYDPYVIKYCP